MIGRIRKKLEHPCTITNVAVYAAIKKLFNCLMAIPLAQNWPLKIKPDGKKTITSGYATMVHGRGCNPHRSTTTFANLEITILWRHWWRHNSKTIRDRQKRRPPRAMKSPYLSNSENRIALRQLLQNRKWRHWWRHNLGSRWKFAKNGSREF